MLVASGILMSSIMSVVILQDVEQLLNYIGVKSLGPRHILANLKELLKTIQSQEYIHTVIAFDSDS